MSTSKSTMRGILNEELIKFVEDCGKRKREKVWIEKSINLKSKTNAEKEAWRWATRKT